MVVWSGELPAQQQGVLVCAAEKVGQVHEAAAAVGRRVDSQHVLLSGTVADLDRGLAFPGEAGLFEAPMGDFTRFEVDEGANPWRTPS